MTANISCLAELIPDVTSSILAHRAKVLRVDNGGDLCLGSYTLLEKLKVVKEGRGPLAHLNRGLTLH